MSTIIGLVSTFRLPLQGQQESRLKSGNSVGKGRQNPVDIKRKIDYNIFIN